MSHSSLKLKGLFSTVSVLALLCGASESAFAAPAARQATNAVTFSNGAGLDGGNPFVSGSTLKYTGNFATTVNVLGGSNILAVDVNGNTPTFSIANKGNGSTLGSVIDSTGGGGGKLNISIATGKSLTLTGTGVQNVNSGGLGFSGDTGAAGQPEAADDDYSAAGTITFAGAGATLNVETGTGGPITLTGAFINPNFGILNVKTGLTVTDGTAGAINVINIGQVGGASTLTMDATAGNFTLLNGTAINFLHADSELALINTSAANDRVFTIHAPITTGTDLEGRLVISSTDAAKKVTITSNNAGTDFLGASNANRLQSISLAGAGKKEIGAKTYAKDITIDGTGDIAFNAEVNSGAGGTLTFNQVASVAFAENVSIAAIDFTTKDGTITVAAGKVLTAAITATNAGTGTLELGAGASLTGTADKLKLVKAGAGNVTLTGFTNVGAIESNGTDTITLPDGFTSTGTIDNTGGGAVKVTFAGGGTVGALGATNPIGNVTIAGDGKVVNLTDDVKVAAVIFNRGAGVAASTLKLAKDVSAPVTFTTTGVIETTAAMTISSAFTTPGGGTLNVTKDTVVTHPTAGALSVINIGTGPKARTLTMDAKAGDFTLLNGTAINFPNADSALALVNTSTTNDRVFTIKAPITTGTDLEGRLVISATDAGHKVTITSNTAGTDFLGASNANRLQSISLAGAGKKEIGAKTYAKAMTVDGTGNITFIDEVDSGLLSTLTFNQAATMQFDANASIAETDFTSKDGTIKLGNGVTFTGDIKSDGNLGTLEFLGNGELKGVATGLRKLRAGVGNVRIDTAGNHTIDEIRATGANKLTLVNGFNLTGKIDNTGGNALQLKFEGDSHITGTLGATNPLGDVEFNGGTIELDDEAKVNDINCTAPTTFELRNNLIMNAMAADGSTINVLDDGIGIKGDITANVLNINLGENEFVLDGDNTLTGNVTITTSYDAGGNTIGHIDAQGTGLDLSGADLDVTLNSNANIADVRGHPFVLLDGTVVAPRSTNPPTINEANRAIRWSYDPVTYTFTAVDDIAPVIAAALPAAAASPEEREVIAVISDRNATGDVLALQDDLGRMTNEQIVETIDDLIPVAITVAVQEAVQDAVDSAIQSSVSSISSRVASLVSPVSIINVAPINVAPTVVTPSGGFSSSPAVIVPTGGGSAPTPASSGSGPVNNVPKSNDNTNNKAQNLSELYGVAAGDDILRFGLWGSPLYSKVTQKQRGSTPGYKADVYGAIVGGDSMVNDDLILGVAASYIDLKVKHQGVKKGDSTKANTYLLSIYGVQQLPQNWFVQGVVTLSHSDIKNRETRRVSSTAYQTARAKYSSSSYGIDAMFGYNHLVGSVIATPMAGLRYGRYSDSGYTESGITRKLTVSRKAFHKLESVIGGRLSTAKEINDVIVMPELHSFFSYDLTGKQAKTQAFMSGSSAPIASPKVKSSRASFNIGTGITAKYSMMEYGLSYDAQIAKKYVGHQGAVKVRVNL